MPPSSSPTFDDLLAKNLFADRAAADVTAYFAEPSDSGGSYTGRHFERLSGGGDRADRSHRITADDLVAVQTLSVNVAPETGVQLLEGHLGLAVTRHLRDIPTTVSLLDPEAGVHLADGAPADKCWRLLVSDAAPGIGATTASKLLARKRPHLIPVYDDVLRCALGHPTNFWASLHHAFVGNPDILNALECLRAHAPQHVSAIRAVDVVVWMAHAHEHETVCKPARLPRHG